MKVEDMNPQQFIDMTKLHSKEWIRYCEILINEQGNILLARPSHMERLILYMMEIEKINRQDVFKLIPFECSPLYYIWQF